MAFREPGQARVHVPDLLGELADPVGQQTQDDTGGLRHRLITALFMTAHIGEPRTGTEELGITQSGQLFPQSGVSSDENGLELVDGLRAGLDRRRLRESVQSRDLYRSVARFCPGAGPPA
ncbi:hypothetical protein [Streptomyces sp. NPDC093600]|uniref:hypothetical protein n=1 Tax=Streptomyces sp. NPDC093600 TaxID=3366047 RepID=UPI00382B25C0